MIKKLAKIIYGSLDSLYLSFDKKFIRRTRNLRLVPNIIHRHGGKISYGEWCHVIGIFQTLLCTHLSQQKNNHILDVGCGTGLLGVASEPFIEDGKYIGIDIIEEDIEFCRRQYPSTNFQFQHLNASNPTYVHTQGLDREKWQIADESVDMVTALSVWTHLNKQDAVFYFREIDRVLKPGGKAIVTFFLLDDGYERSLQKRADGPGRYHNLEQRLWIFDQPSSESANWLHPQWVKHPEDAIGVKPQGLSTMLEGTNLQLTNIHPGNWKEMPGIFFQDILIFEKNQ